VIPFLTVGVYKNRKYCKEHAFANVNAEEEAAPAVDDTQIRHMIADAMRGFAETLAAQMGE